MMEVRLPSVMETLFHWPTVSWAIASAFVLFWGTGLFASSKQLRKDSLIQSRLLYLRRKSAFVLRFCCEEFLYTFMALLNMAMGVVFWVLDWYHDGAPPPNANYFPVENQLAKVKEPDLRNPTMTEGKATHRPKRAGIFRPRKGYGDVCGCWGYEVEDLPASAGKFNNEVSSYKNGYVASQVEEEDNKLIRPRWSECQCPECSAILMPMKLAANKLFVRCEDRPSGGESCTNGYGEETAVTDMSRENLTDLLNVTPRLVPNTPTRGIVIHHLLLNCVQSFYADETAVVFIHGLFSSSAFWFDTKIVPCLSDDIKAQHRLLVPDILGCGRSPRPIDSVYTLSDHIDALEKSVIQRHGLKSFHLVAHSMGCIMALVLAARCLERVRSITLIAPVYPPGNFDENGKAAQLPCDSVFSLIDPFTVKGIRALLVSKYYNLSRAVGHLFYARHKFWVNFFHQKLKRYPVSFIADYLTNHHDAAWHMTHNTLLAGTHAVIPALIKLQKRGQRILVIHGVEDTSCQISSSEEMSRRFSIVELHPVPGYGHVDVLWKREQEPCRLIEGEINAGDAKFAIADRTAS